MKHRPTRLVAIGVGLGERKAVPIGHAHQCTVLPPCGEGASTSNDAGPAEPEHVPLDVFEVERAKDIGQHLTSMAFRPTPRLSHDVDELIIADLLASGVLRGGGRSSYVAELHGALNWRKRLPGMLACADRFC